MSTYAILSAGTVTNVIVWDGNEPYAPDEGSTVLSVPPEVGIGWTFDGDTWIAPPPSGPLPE